MGQDFDFLSKQTPGFSSSCRLLCTSSLTSALTAFNPLNDQMTYYLTLSLYDQML